MNARTRSAPAQKIAAPAKNLILVPLSQLRPSQRNVRKTVGASITELAASIARVGLLQNLTVTLARDGEHYEVVAGARRLGALKLLAKKRRIAKDYEVPCLLVADACARTASLTENVQREAMHAADQFEAFAALVKEGRPIEDIAADFSVTPLVVQRRLKLANVSPRLLADYRSDRTDAVTLEQLMALAITDDHAAQEAAFYDAPDWQRTPAALRERLTARAIDAQHPLARFVGLNAYTAAGGGTRRDLFAEDDSGIYLDDAALLDRLVREKLAARAEDVRAEGWAWVEAVPHLSHADRQAFENAPRQRRAPSPREARRLASLQARLDKINAALEEAYDAEVEDEDKAEALHERCEQVAGELRVIEDALQAYAPDVRAVAGAVVTLDREGGVVIHRGLLREAEAKALRTLHRLREGFTDAEGDANDGEGEDAEPTQTANLSDRLAQRLSAHRTAALQIEVARHPRVALAALVHGMVQTVLQDDHDGGGLPLGVRLTVQNRLEGMAPDWPESPAAMALRKAQQASGGALPERSAALFAALLAKPQDELVRLLAVCVAATVDVVTPRAAQAQPGTELAQAVGLNMAAWWKPTAEGYFDHVSKAVILAAVGQFASAHVMRLSKLKKADLAREAERLAEGTGWMPAVLAVGTTGGAEPDAADREVAAEAVVETADEARTLAA
jgi:ParB family chromosome partitioning protein